MYQRTTGYILRLLKVPHEPAAPHGNPASLRVFRAGRNLFKLKLLGWGAAQLVALAGIIFWLTLFIDVDTTVTNRRRTEPAPDPLIKENFTKTVESISVAGATSGQILKSRKKNVGLDDFKEGLVELILRLPPWAVPLLWAVKIIGIIVYLAQLPVTYLIARMDYELRWYMVTDRSLRIRHGVWKVAESTMSFANIQQVVVSQGPVQRLLGLSDVKVQSAGGGRSDEHKPGKDDMHMGLFHSVTNGSEIRDLILERLRRFRESGLGDPEENSSSAEESPSSASGELLAAARELAAEARSLRVSLG